MDCCNKEKKDTQSNTLSNSFVKNKIFLLCLLSIISALGAIFIFKVPTSSLLTFGLFLLCPLLHIFMMKNHKH
jgi:hypothetical protein